ncbi:hypothetical protein [Denitratimonas sp. CY0512]|uniref:hypothetical protein n=1 Tax=Denitratimonas sp. CY0512 TaxID=3131940 RepID=UPI0030ABC11D
MSCISAPALHRIKALTVACMLAGGLLGAAAAHALEPVQDSDTHVLPVWNTSSGRVEALLLLSPQQADGSATDWLLSREPKLPGIGLRSSGDSGNRLSGNLHLDNNAGLALLCNQGIHVAMALGPLAEQCLLAEVASSNDPLMLRSSSPGVLLDAHWQSDEGALDLSFGLSWLQTSLEQPGPDTLPTLGSALRHPSIPSMLPATLGEINLRQLHFNSSLNLRGQRWVSLGGALGTQELLGVFGAPQRWDTATVTLGIGYRGLSGRLTGRLIELPEGQGNWNGLDLGFSWRTPWQGELSFGAQNLLNQKPDTSQWPLHDLPAVIEAPGGRTPYVRYKQDL